MSYRFKQVLFVIILIPFLVVSCIKDDFSMGSGNLQSNVVVAITDTCTVNLTTIQDDSVITSGLGYAWVGKFVDTASTFGSPVTATSYLSFPRPAYTADTSARFDSLCLFLKCYPDYYGDTTFQQTIYIQRLISKVVLNTNGYLYAHNYFNIDPAHLATINLTPRPGLRRTVETRLPDTLGIRLLNKLMFSPADISNDDLFTSFFNGLALVPDSFTNTMISSFTTADSGIIMRLFYHYFVKGSLTKNSIDFPLNTASLFNHIDYNRFTTKKGISSKATGNEAFIQGITGCHIKIDFPYIQNMGFLGKYVSITGAQVYIKPVKGSYNERTMLPDSLYLNLLSKTTEEQQSIQYIFSSPYIFVSRDYVNYDRNTNYGINVSNFIRGQMHVFDKDKQILAISLPLKGLRYPLRRVILGDKSNFKNQLTFQIKVMIYEGN